MPIEALARNRPQKGRDFLLYHGNTTLGWRSVGRTSFAAGEAKVEAGVWRRVYDAAMNHIGYQPLKSAKPTDEEIPSIPSCASISRSEMEINAGLRGDSRTAGSTEKERGRRVERGLMPEDRIERVVAKVRVWKHLGAKRGDIARVYKRHSCPKCQSILRLDGTTWVCSSCSFTMPGRFA